ncbi:MAG TPA: hypothetical protein VFK70_07085, partial [Vicinamibacteria bacterium]|nr:hypothetical protein [Vicinamibacteria bacterium]
GLVEDLQPEERRLEAFDDICLLLGARGDGVLVAVGPNVESVLVTSPAAALALPPASQSLRPPEGRCGEGGHWRAELAEMRPFFSHYPFLVWEDPYQTYSMLIQHAYTTRAYREPLGEVTVWRVKGDPATH